MSVLDKIVTHTGLVEYYNKAIIRNKSDGSNVFNITQRQNVAIVCFAKSQTEEPGQHT